VILQPILNLLILLSKIIFSSFGLAIIALTVIVRLIISPITAIQLRSSRETQKLAPQLKRIRKKYANDARRVAQETSRLYKEGGVHPLGCVLPLLIQFIVLIGLYQSIVQVIGYSPENMHGLYHQMYHWSAIEEVIPLGRHFLWLDLTKGYIVMAILTALSMWILQKMSTLPIAAPSQGTASKVMLWILPLVFGLAARVLPSGLSLYWVFSTIIGIAMQYRVTGWGTLKAPTLSGLRKALSPPARNPAKAKGASGVRKRYRMPDRKGRGGDKPASIESDTRNPDGHDNK
jgi:YidC/Oxa1 family membrane protein insertase